MDTTAAGIAAFWAWWEGARPRVQEALGSGRFENDAALQDELSSHVHAIDDALAWELGGRDGEWSLVLSPEGQFPKRRITERWVRAAPTHAGWRYRPSREGSGEALGMTLRTSGHDIAFAQLRFAVETDDTRRRVHLRVWHPAFASVDEQVGARIAFLALDALLGEDAVETWVGEVNPVQDSPADAIDGKALRASLEDLKESPGDHFSLLKGERDDGAPVSALMLLGLKRMHHLDAQTHVAVTVTGYEANDEGFPTRDALSALQQLEDELVAKTEPLGVWYGHVVTPGRFTLGFYAADGLALKAALEQAGARLPFEVTLSEDPEWEHFRAF